MKNLLRIEVLLKGRIPRTNKAQKFSWIDWSKSGQRSKSNQTLDRSDETKFLNFICKNQCLI